MRCPKCGSRHIVDGMCVMCGAMVVHNVKIPERTCLACGRKERFIGSVCKDCEESIAWGAKALQRAAQRNMRRDKDPVFAECPGVTFLDELWQKFHAWREHQREVARAWKVRNPEKLAAQRERAKRKIAENREEFNRKRRESEAYQEWRKRYRSTPEYREKQREYDRRRRQKPEQIERRRAADRERQRKKAAEFKALPPDEQARIRAEFAASPAGQRKKIREREYARKCRQDPQKARRIREAGRRYDRSEKGKAVRARIRKRAKERERLIRDNEALERESEAA